MTRSVDIPTLTTERLTLRAQRPDDFDAYAAFYGSERSWGMGGPLERPQAWRAFAAELGHWQMRGYGFWAVDVTETGETVGQVGFWHPEGWSEVEIGWAMFAGSEGKGYAYEAAKAVRDWGLDTLGLTALVSYIDPPNTRSVRLAERLGGWLDPVASAVVSADQGEEVVVYRHWPPADSDGGMEAYA